ncbi:TM0106 family RecB-like putative nuclease [Rhodococcus aerolatus]
MEPVLLESGVLTGCRHRVSLDAAAAAGPDAAPAVTDPGALQRVEEAREHRRAVAASLAASSPGWTSVPAALPRSLRVERTRDLAATGAERIWAPALPDAGGLRGAPDLLLRASDGGYLPVIVVNHRTTDPGAGATTSPLEHFDPAPDPARSARSHTKDRLRLAHARRLLEAAGLASADTRAGVVGLDADCLLVHDLAAPDWPGGRSTLAEHAARAADRAAVVAAAAGGEVVTAASRVGECRSCRWWPRCEAELVAAHDVSLVVRGSAPDVLREAGITTVDDLARAEAPPAAWRGGPFTDAVTTARAWLAGAPLVRRQAEVQVRRADVEVDVDMESYLEHGAYLWGTLLAWPGEEPQYRPFATWDPLPTDDEARSFAELWAWLTGVRERAAAAGLTFAAYCYSEAAENRWLLGSARRFAGLPGVPHEDEVAAFIASPDWVDVFEAVGEAFVCPQGRGLKKVAPVAGFAWDDAEAGGEASMGWYRRAVGMDGEVELDQRERVLRYNADDVWATRVLRVWMDTRAAAEVPLAADLPVPPPAPAPA